MNLRQPLIFDSTLRDGSHAVKQNLTEKQIREYCKAIDGCGNYVCIVGHGNGLGASSIQMGLSGLDEIDMLKIAREELKKTSLGAFITVGFGTIKNQIIPAIEAGATIFCVACHCTEADTTKPHISYLVSKGIEVYGVLMMYHMASKERLLDEAKKIESYGAKGVILMDSAGTSTLEKVKDVVGYLSSELNITIGFHSHNNFGMAVALSYVAYQSGADIMDGTLRGFGSGAGNCQLEALVALFEKEGIKSGVNLKKMLEVSEKIVQPMWEYKTPVNDISIVSGYAGVVSTVKHKVLKIAQEYHVSGSDIFLELGKRNVIAGEDDVILEVAEKLKSKMLSH
ncbi:4-hydroxy-2-oxovalerate aldolase [Petralouisia muris]|uniref:4-hydroxy-2-oxovalerate aldolase n=1 Tax=Petralouisia muris TaxID=3032872 RepID=A0AC61RU86_9FIRM|nr:4-hydroxy-2-oxovalerate aldolase [Petralouisia muris]